MRPSSLLTALTLLGLALIILSPALLWGQEKSGDSAQELLLEPREVPEVSVQSIEPGLEEADSQLRQRFGHFLSRRDLGFDLSLIKLVRKDIEELRAQLTALLEAPTGADAQRLIALISPLVIILIFAVLYLLLERQFVRWTLRIQWRTHLDISAGLTTLLRALVITLGRGCSILLLILLSIFPVRAVFGTLPWTLFMTQGLLFFLAYRGAKTFLSSLLRLSIQDSQDQHHKERVEGFISALLRISLFFILLLSLLKNFDYHEQVIAFISFAFRLSLASLPLILFFIGDSLLHLLPTPQRGEVYKNLRALLHKYYRPILGVTIALLLFNAAGYVAAATFLLTRAYGLLIFGTLWFAALERLQALVERREAEARESESEVSPLLAVLEDWVSKLGTIIVVALALHFIGLLQPLFTLLRVPFLTVGSVQVSLYNLLMVALIVLVTALTVRLIKASLNAKLYPALGVEMGSAYAINTLVSYALFTLAFILCLSALGVRLSSLVVLFAALGVGIGFGLQNLTENLISGFILLFGRAVKKGDFITVNEVYGRVETVGARSVVLRTPDNFTMLIPSKEIVSGRIINWSFHDFLIRLHIPISLDYDCDPQEARQVLLRAARQHPDILPEPKPEVWLSEFGDFGLNFELLVYYDCRITSANALKGSFNFLLLDALDEANLSIPYPQQALHLRSIDDSVQFPLSLERPELSNGAGDDREAPSDPADHDPSGRASR